jgi:hypothetical protein
VVSGKPVSFITQLYEPRYVQRPFAELAENRAANPLVYQGALEIGEAKAQAPAARTLGGNAVGGIAGAPQAARDVPLNGRNFAQLSSFADTAAGQPAGELFEYSFATPVTVKQGESAMLPFLQQKIGARKLLVYAESYGLNPRDAAELNNNTGKTLDGGPITVYDAGSYAGEALVETMPMGDTGRTASNHYLDLEDVRRRLAERFELVPAVMPGGGPARYVSVAGTNLRIGFITPISQHFCASCNRVRLAADGALYLCLGQEDKLELRPLLRAGIGDGELKQAIRAAIVRKPERHEFREQPQKIIRFMSMTGG